MSSMQSDTFFRGVKRMKPDPFFRGVKRMKPVPFCPYDYIPSPRDLELSGGAPFVPVRITHCNRPKLTYFSQLALEFYHTNPNQEEERSGVTFEFHDLVKCTSWIDTRARQYVPDGDTPLPPSPTKFYITFQAKPMGDRSSSLDDITIFQANISIDKDKLPVVQDCRIRSKQCFDECGRLAALVNEEEPQLFSGLKFFFCGFYYGLEYRKSLEDLAEQEGGDILKSKAELEAVRDGTLLFVYNHDSLGSKLDYDTILQKRLNEVKDNYIRKWPNAAPDVTVQIVNDTWILESFAACKLQPYR